MAIIGVQFDKMRVTPILDAATNVALAGTTVLPHWGLALSHDGLTITVGVGAVFVHGRYIRITSPITISVPANYTGWFVLTVDLTKNNDSSGNPVYDNYSVTNNQVYLRYIADNDRRYEDLNWSGNIYDLSFLYFVTDGTSITTFNTDVGLLTSLPNVANVRQMSIINDRVYTKQALWDVTSSNKYRQFSLLLKRQGRRVTAQVNMKTVTTLAWEQLAELSNYPGYKPDGGDYSGMLNEMSYNTEPGGLYIGTTSLRMMHVGRTDVKECNYSGAITYFTNDDFPPDSDITSGYHRALN